MPLGPGANHIQLMSLSLTHQASKLECLSMSKFKVKYINGAYPTGAIKQRARGFDPLSNNRLGCKGLPRINNLI
jgi:hypothetical protein